MRSLARSTAITRSGTPQKPSTNRTTDSPSARAAMGPHHHQVWPLTHFSLLTFCKLSLICLEDTTVHTLFVPPSNSFTSVSDLLEAFEQTLRPSWAVNLDWCVASGIQNLHGHRKVCCARRGDPRTQLTTSDEPCLCVCKNYTFI